MINRAILLGNLTPDSETRQAGAITVCTLRIAVNDRAELADVRPRIDLATTPRRQRQARHLAPGKRQRR
jgi:hypothetical protein